MRIRFFPILLIAIGLGVLLGNLGIIPAADVRAFMHTWWPAVLVALGAAMLLRPRGHWRDRHHRCRREDVPPSQAQVERA